MLAIDSDTSHRHTAEWTSDLSVEAECLPLLDISAESAKSNSAVDFFVNEDGSPPHSLKRLPLARASTHDVFFVLKMRPTA